jgi:hypothetical protein
MKARPGWTVAVTLGAIALIFGLAGAPRAAEQKFTEFVSQKFKISLQLPSHWVSQSHDNNLIYSGPKGTEEAMTTITLQFIKPQSGTTLEAQAQGIQKQWGTAKKYRLLSKKNLQVAGQPAMQMVVEYQMPQGTEMYRQEQLIIQRGEFFYWMGYIAPVNFFAKYHTAMDQAIRSFQFLP